MPRSAACCPALGVMTVPHGLRSGWAREQASRALIERALQTTDGREYLAILRSVADWYDFDLLDELLSTALCLRPEAIPHRRAKQEALGREAARRRQPPAADDSALKNPARGETRRRWRTVQCSLG